MKRAGPAAETKGIFGSADPSRTENALERLISCGLAERRAQLRHGRRLVQERPSRNLGRYRINPLCSPCRLLTLRKPAGVHVLDRHADVISLSSIGVALSPFDPLQYAVETLHETARKFKIRSRNHLSRLARRISTCPASTPVAGPPKPPLAWARKHSRLSRRAHPLRQRLS
jgi:hypothetical protein